jgi:hypothetical protein
MLIPFSIVKKSMELLQINNGEDSGETMAEKTATEGLKQENHGLKDPGNMLIVVYIFFVLFLLLFANMASAKMDSGRMTEGAFSTECADEALSPCLSPYLFGEEFKK